MNGICLLSDSQKMKNAGVFDIFPRDWNVIKDSKKKDDIVECLRKSDHILSLVCANKIESLMKDLKRIKCDLLCKLKNCNQDDLDIITQILILDQLILLASEKTISSCSSDCHACSDNGKNFTQSGSCPSCNSNIKGNNEKYFEKYLHYKSKDEEKSFDLEKSIQYQEQTTK